MNKATGVRLTAVNRCAAALRSLVLAGTLCAAAGVQGQTATTTTLTSSANPATAGQNLTLTANVSGASPTGTVTFATGANHAKRIAYLRFEGPNGSTTITGSEDIPKIWTALDGAKLSTTGGVSSLALDGSWDYVYTMSNLSDFVFGTGDFDIRFRMKSTAPFTVPLNFYSSGGDGWMIYINGSGQLEWYESGNPRKVGTISVTDGAWHDIEVSRTAGVLYFYVDSARDGAGTPYTAALTAQVGQFTVGKWPGMSNWYDFNGLLDDVRISKGIGGNTGPTRVVSDDGALTLGSVAVSGGAAVLTTSVLGPGQHVVYARYGGNAVNAASVSADLSQTIISPVSLAQTTTTLVVSPSTVMFAQSVTLSAQVQGSNPSGTVTFTDGPTSLGSAALIGGIASFSISNLALGSHSLSASYAGDANNTASSAAAVNLMVNPSSGMIWQYGYDAMGRLHTAVDPNGLASYVFYDKLGRPIQTQQPPNTGSATPTVITLGYNLADGLTSVADPRNLTTSYSPTGLGTVASQSSPDTATSTFTYDAKGNMRTSVDARGKQTTYGYDNLDRLTSITYPSGTATTFQYDGGTSPTPAEKGELTKMTDESGQTTYSHDALGRLKTKTVTIGSKTFTTGYSWGDTGSALDKLTAITYPGGSRVNYSYDAKGSISAISVNPVNANGSGVSSTAQTLLGTVTYSAENNVSGWLWSDGKARTIGYDNAGLVSSYMLGDPSGTGTKAGTLRTVSRDSAGRITGYGHANNGSSVAALNQTFGYDNLNRLLTATLNGAGTAYSYDATGNRTSKSIGATTYSNTVASNSNRLTQTQDVGGSATISYDAAGHITGDGTNSYAYSDRGRMVSATTPGGVVSYSYNGLNQRAGKSGPANLVPTGAAYYLYDEAGQLLGEYDASGAPVYETVYLGSLPVGVLKQVGTAGASNITVTLHHVHADHIDTARVITKQDHTIVWRWDSAEAFGATAPDQNPSSLGVFTFNQRFPGQVFDAETGLFQNWNREYNARQGRYIQSDPIGLAGGINTFTYVSGNPLLMTDPQGLANGPAVGWIWNPQQPRVPIPAPLRSDGQGWGYGCGDSTSDGFVPDRYLLADFMPACRRHDKCYETCGARKDVCDANFGNDLTSACAKSAMTFSPACLVTAGVYRAAMSTSASESAFKRAQGDACSCKP